MCRLILLAMGWRWVLLVWGSDMHNLSCWLQGRVRISNVAWFVQACTAPLATAVRKSQAMLDSGAYLHQYEAHGLPPSAVRDAVYSTQDIIAAYEAM